MAGFLFFAPHVETSADMILPDDYLKKVADALHAIGGLLVLDCIASGAMWVDMQATGVDVLSSSKPVHSLIRSKPEIGARQIPFRLKSREPLNK